MSDHDKKRPKSGTWFVVGVLVLFFLVVAILFCVLIQPRLDQLKKGRGSGGAAQQERGK